MKKYGFLLVALLTLWACGDDDTTPQQEVTCSITAPAEGTTIDLATTTSMTIKGEGAVNVGKIESVTLKVGGKVVSEVTKVPFSYDYAFANEQAIGDLEIELTVKGDAGKEKTATTNVTLKKTESGTDPEPELEQEITCEITTPTPGASFDLATATTMSITGKALVNVGSIESLVLKVGGIEVSPAPVPAEDGTFSYDYTFGTEQPLGDLLVELIVKGDKTETPKIASVTVTLTKTEAPVSENTFTDPRDGHVYKYVTIGTQDWMAQDLAYLPDNKVFNPATSVASCDGDPQWFVLNYYGEDANAARETKEYKQYGVLYNWYAAMNQKNATGVTTAPSGVQGICPPGWHLPSIAEWKIMEEYVASQLPDVLGNGFEDFMNPGEYTGFDENCKNVWGALAGNTGWGATAMGGENPDLKKGPQNTFGLNLYPSGTTYRMADMYGNWFKSTDSSAMYWATDYLSSGGGTADFSNNSYRPKYSSYGGNPITSNSVRCVKD